LEGGLATHRSSRDAIPRYNALQVIMKKHSLLFILATGLAIFLIGSNRPSLLAQGTNLLQNPSFEQPFSGGSAQNWQRWNMSTEKTDEECLVAYHYQPKWNAETNSTFVRDGAASQYVGNNWDPWAGGVYQTVPATPGATYRFSFYGRGRGTNEPSPAPSESGLQINMRAGIDPNGSGQWNDADVVWGPAGSPHDAWQQFTVETTATSNQITVFTSANWGVTGVNQCRQFLDTWYDAAQLAVQTLPTAIPPTAPPATQAPPTTTFPPAPTGGVPTEPAAATLVATLTMAAPTQTPTPAGTSAICVNAFLDDNGNGLHDPGEGYVAGVTLTVAQGNTVIGQAASTGTETPVCFGDLPAGEYQVAQTLPPTLELTTQGNATVDVGEGQTVGLEFGSRLRATATAEGAATPTEASAAEATPATGEAGAGGAPSWLVYLGIGAILIGVVLLGALLFMVLRR
jgi:hypothetical protein